MMDKQIMFVAMVIYTVQHFRANVNRILISYAMHTAYAVTV